MDELAEKINDDKYLRKHISESIIENAWLGLGDISKININNPILYRTLEDRENPGMHFLRVLRRPEYLAFAAKIFLNVNLLPIQAVIMEELWKRPFPMFIASRGFGKMVSGDTPIRVKDGWKNMVDIKIGDKVYGGDGKLCSVISKTDLQKHVKFYKITLRDGRQIRCCKDHLWKVWYKCDNQREINNKYRTISTKKWLIDIFGLEKIVNLKNLKRVKNIYMHFL